MEFYKSEYKIDELLVKLLFVVHFLSNTKLVSTHPKRLHKKISVPMIRSQLFPPEIRVP